jgi:dipeptidyl aminopeptidase/acylaminoacyl peptidase
MISPFGSWASPLDAAALARGQIGVDNLRSVNDRLYWTETLPDLDGRIGLFRRSAAGDIARLTPKAANVRSRVHEYGGAPYVVAGERVYYCEYADQRLYQLHASGAVDPWTPAGCRYADLSFQPHDPGRESALIAVCEDHRDPREVRNSLMRLPLSARPSAERLYAASDFVAYPRLSPDGRRLAFLTWNHPHMPWDSSELKVAELTDRGLGAAVSVAGGLDESVLDPQWDADGSLYFISDRSGYWNLYVWQHARVRAVWPRAAEFASPLWSLGQSNYALLGDGRALVRFGVDGVDRLAILNLRDRTARVLDLPYVHYAQLTPLGADHAAVLAAPADGPRIIARIDMARGHAEALHSAGRALLPPSSVSVAVPIEFPSAGNRRAHAFYYPPRNPHFQGPPGTLPPLLTLVHGGPTAQSSPAYAPKVQFWTSRGFAVVDVNFGGSSGFGRAYRKALDGNWGVVDVEDVVAAARHLGLTGRADPCRTAISGGSAGGYTTLMALCSGDVFTAGADYYGISDLTLLARDTHKFESHYLNSLLGPLPQAQAVYERRSPLHHLDGFKAPLIVFQGALDPVVPPNQSERIVEALRTRGVPVAYLLYPDETHGFRRPENIRRSLECELAFYGQVFGFQPADELPPLLIDNLPGAR